MKCLIVTFFISFNVFAADNLDSFIQLAKKTASVYSGTSQIDVNNNEQVSFETLLNNQKVYLTLTATKMDSTVYTVINSEANLSKSKKNRTLPLPPVVLLGNLGISLDSNGHCSNHGTAATGIDTNCTAKDCTIKQLIISKCNETNCWGQDSSTDRKFFQGLSGEFSLVEKLDISKCLTNNNEGVKHLMTFTESETNKGATLRYQLSVVNDVTE